MENTTKVCSKCNQEKSIKEFSIRTDTNKHRRQCKQCVYESTKKFTFFQDNSFPLIVGANFFHLSGYSWILKCSGNNSISLTTFLFSWSCFKNRCI